MPTSTPHRIRGRIATYNAGTIADIDRDLQRLTASWASLLEMSGWRSELFEVPPPTAKMRGDYQWDVDLLLDKRAELQS